MKRVLLAFPFVLLLGYAFATRRTATHSFEEIAPGVYFVTGGDQVTVGSNSLVVVNDDDVLLVDSHISPTAARALITSIKTITDKPVRTLVNSHYHFDHANGNQVFDKGVEIIGHEFTRRKLLGDVLHEATYVNNAGPGNQQWQMASLQKRIATGDAAAAGELARLKRHVAELAEVKPTAPNVTLTDKLTLYRGKREIQILFLGRGHTAGDLVVYLPAEKVVFTGDLFYPGAPYLGDGYPEEFVATLEKLKGLRFDVAAGGHGGLVRDRKQINFNQQYIRQYWAQVKGFHAAKLTAKEARAKLEFGSYKAFAQFQLNEPGVLDIEIARMYRLLDGGGEAQ